MVVGVPVRHLDDDSGAFSDERQLIDSPRVSPDRTDGRSQRKAGVRAARDVCCGNVEQLRQFDPDGLLQLVHPHIRRDRPPHRIEHGV